MNPRTVEEMLEACERHLADPTRFDAVIPSHAYVADQARRLLVLEAQVIQLMRMLEEVPLMVSGMIESAA